MLLVGMLVPQAGAATASRASTTRISRGTKPPSESSGGWRDGRAAYRCRHGHTTAAPRDPDRPKNAYVREDRALVQLRALHTLLSGAPPAQPRRRRTRQGVDARPAASLQEAISYLRENEITLSYDQAAANLHAGTGGAAKAITVKAS